MKINYPLLPLAIGAFGIGTTEFSPMGLLPVIARGVDVSIPAAGMLISAYAVGYEGALQFNKAFKNRMQVPPRTWRLQNRLRLSGDPDRK